METTKKSQIVGIKNAGIVIICCFIVAVCIFSSCWEIRLTL